MTGPGSPADGFVYDDIRDFLNLEARLLDQRKFDEWNALFTPEGMYWVPLSRSAGRPGEPSVPGI